MDCELGFEVGAVLLEGVAVYAEVVGFEELDVPGGVACLRHWGALTNAFTPFCGTVWLVYDGLNRRIRSWLFTVPFPFVHPGHPHPGTPS